MIARDFKPSSKVLETLLSVTKTITATFLGSPHFGKTYAANLNQAHEQLEALVHRLSIELELGNVVESLG